MKKLVSMIIVLALMLSVCTFAQTDKATVKSVQEALNAAAFECGTPDGIAGKKTYTSIEAYRRANGLEVNDTIDRDLLVAMGLIKVYDKEILFQNVP